MTKTIKATGTKKVILQVGHGNHEWDFFVAEKHIGSKKSYYKILSRVLVKSPDVKYLDRYAEAGYASNDDLGYEFAVKYYLEKDADGHYYERMFDTENFYAKDLKCWITDFYRLYANVSDWTGIQENRWIGDAKELEYGVDTVEFNEKIAVTLAYSELNYKAWNEVNKEAKTINQAINLKDLSDILCNDVSNYMDEQIVATMSVGGFKATANDADGYDLYYNDEYVLTLERTTAVWHDAQTVAITINSIDPKYRLEVMRMWVNANTSAYSLKGHIFGIRKTLESVLFD